MIDEKKLIEEMEKLKQEVNMPVDIVWNNLLKVCIDTVNEQPKVGEWIPCSKRLPKKHDWYYITARLETTYTTDHCWWNGEEWQMYDFTKVKEYNEEIEIIAWMPLPTPYNADMRKKVD